ncbi:leucine--tRNA ligase [Buchnera aphidicola (Nippolachnus piri)]|uniref:leucine--tRNA ligase n=1 Tax=Buchnera aphidicola TaxID=9 RepID=UPI0031B6C09C
MEKEYKPQYIENFVQKHWEKYKTFSVYKNKKKKKFYCLPMMPYPSGNLHMGHIRNYTISDIISRFQRMLGKNVLQPIGWDAFGLPAEQAAIIHNIHPEKWTKKNIQNMRIQLKKLGFSYDWNREITTCNPNYYRWEQWFFIQLFKKKIIYKKNTLVNWCPQDKTVLANEQVIQNSCWRCQTTIIFKKIPQWFLKITNYAEELLNDLKSLTKWPQDVINMQKKWIGKSTGLQIKFKIQNQKKYIEIYTTECQTIMNIKFIAISPEHPFTKTLILKNLLIKNFIKKYQKNFLNKEKMIKKKLYGINTQNYVLHPLTKKKIPIWIAYYVKNNYATSAIMGVPKYNSIDLKFSLLHHIHYKKKNDQNNNLTIYDQKNNINNISKKKNFSEIKNFLIKKKIAKKKIYYKLQDWSISRQRYWGTPIPIAYTQTGKIVTIPENQLPVILPKNIIIKNDINILHKNKKWINIILNSQNLIRETDTLDTFFESSWYYARYTNPYFIKGMIDIHMAKYWLPIDLYIGGIEHAILHLMYFRFFHKLLRDFGFVKSNEPSKKLLCQGMVLSDAFYYFEKNGKKIWLNKKNIKIKYNVHKQIISAKLLNGIPVHYAGKIKMSKSKKNGVNPLKILKKYGADTLRLFLIYASPIESSLEWQENGLIGMHRFLKKIWNFIYLIKNSQENFKKYKISELIFKKINFELNNTILKITKSLKNTYSLNTAISYIIKFFNFFKKKYQKYEISLEISKKSIKTILILLYPFAPHICFVLWKKIYNKKKKSIDEEKWPIPDFTALKIHQKNITIQINGKKRHIMKVNIDETKKKIIQKITNLENLKKYFKNCAIIKIIYIPLKIINFVLKN